MPGAPKRVTKTKRVATKTKRPATKAKVDIDPQASDPDDSFSYDDLPLQPLYPFEPKPEDEIKELEDLMASSEVEEEHFVNAKAIIADIRAGKRPADIYQGGKAKTWETVDESKGWEVVWYHVGIPSSIDISVFKIVVPDN